MTTARPIDLISARFEITQGPPRTRARCPAHGSRGGTVSITEYPNEKVRVKCFAGCATEDILRAVGLTLRDLYPNGDSQRRRDRDLLTQRREYARAPEATVAAAIDREIERLRERLRSELGYDRPLRSSDYNAIRERIAKIYEIELASLPPAPWECAPHDTDPSWPTCYMTALEEAVRIRWHASHPDAQAGESDPSGPGFEDHMRAEQLALEWLRGMA